MTNYIVKIKCGARHSYVLSDDNQHYLFGWNQYNICTIHKDDRFNAITIPYCINHTINRKTNGKKIKDIVLGNDVTAIIVVDED